MAWPNCLRCLAYLVAASSAPCAMPSARAAIEMRPPSRIFRLLMKPSPSGPRRFSAGTRQSEKITSEVSLARMPSLFSFLPGLESGHALFQDEGADAVGVFGFVGDRHGHADVGVMSVGGEGFRAVQNPVIAVAHGGGASAARVGAGFGLGERPRAEFLAMSQRDEIFALLLFGSRICRCGWCRANCAPRR